MSYLREINLDHSMKVVLPCVSIKKWSLPPISRLSKSWSLVHTQGKKIKLHLLGGGWSIYIHYLEFFCKKDFPLLYHVSIWPCIYISLDSLIFIRLQFNVSIIVLFCVSALATEDFFWLVPVSFWRMPIILFFTSFSLSGTRRCLKIILCFLPYGSNHFFPEGSGSFIFYWRMVFRN